VNQTAGEANRKGPASCESDNSEPDECELANKVGSHELIEISSICTLSFDYSCECFKENV